MNKLVHLILAAIVMAPHAAQAQKPPVQGGVVVASEPGKAAVVALAKVTATVVAIDKASRTVTLKVPKGRTVDVIAGDSVRNFDQIRVGDNVVVEYQEALTLELKKAKAPLGTTETVTETRAKPGERPAGAVRREIVALANVVAVDPKKSIISLKGPRGNVVDLKVQNQDHFKVVKVGDQVEAVYTEALAVSVTPAAKSSGKK